MGQRKMLIGVLAGALVGALVMQFDKDARYYTKSCLNKVKDNSSELLNNPEDTVRKLRNKFDQLNNTISVGAENTINALEQVESTLDRLVNKN